MSTQRERVLQMLQDAGPAGVHTFTMRAAYVGNPSQRIAELEAAGHHITHQRERLNGQAIGTRYRLISEGAGRAGGPPERTTPVVEGTTDPSTTPTLLDTPAPVDPPVLGRRVPSAYDPWEEAA